MKSADIHSFGLTDQEVLTSRNKNGLNTITARSNYGFFIALKNIITEPMFLLLLAASAIYFISGDIGDALFMLAAIVLISLISLYQEARSRSALSALKKLSQPNCNVIRNGISTVIKIEDIVVGDCMVVEEGAYIPADGIIIQSNDFFVNESILTGESFAVLKNEHSKDNAVLQGTNVTGGLAVCTVTAIGNKTALGKIGKSLENITEEKTPLQQQINNFVKKMAIAGLAIFICVLAINYWMSNDILDSLLKSLTLAMSILPEEIPVAFTTFMALGAWRLMKMGIIVKQIRTVETLGSATVICTDKTGTLTENKMTLSKVYLANADRVIPSEEIQTAQEKELIRYAMFASEPIPFDPMEIALHTKYSELYTIDERTDFKMVHEYPLSGTPPLMTHIFEDASGNRIIAVKGAPEAILKISDYPLMMHDIIRNKLDQITKEGYRVLGVGTTEFNGNNFPETQQEFKLKFLGFVAFYDPAKNNIPEVLKIFYDAGIEVKIITGDNPETTETLAKNINFRGIENSITGPELMELSEETFENKVLTTNIYARMYPDAKLRVINVLKKMGHIVAMVGDGVNDAPALKTAHIGIAMGKKGSEIAKQASSLILIEDDLAKLAEAIALGRKIYANLKKAIQYIISIHIPIILVVFIPLALGWIYPSIFTPVHIIFLEIIMGPTCSIIYENEPMEKNAMTQKPRPATKTFFNLSELTTSIYQGLVITVGALFIYQSAIYQQLDEDSTRTMVFLTLVSANIFLTLINRSFYYSVFTTLRYKNKLMPIIISITILATALILMIPEIRDFFLFEMLHIKNILLAIAVGFLSVVWYEIIKLKQRNKVLQN